MSRLTAAIDNLGEALLRNMDRVLEWATSEFKQTDDGVVIEALVDRLRGRGVVDEVLLTALSVAIKTTIPVSKPSPTPTVKLPSIAVFFPTIAGSVSIATYGASEFAVDTCWARFLAMLNQAVLRGKLQSAIATEQTSAGESLTNPNFAG
jgi:hypothetical protein